MTAANIVAEAIQDSSSGNRMVHVIRRDHNASLVHSFQELLTAEDFVDVTLCCQGKSVRAHRLLLASYSDYLREILLQAPTKHPTIILHDVNHGILTSLLDFLYFGRVEVHESNWDDFCRTASVLGVCVNAEIRNDKNSSKDLNSDGKPDKIKIPEGRKTPPSPKEASEFTQPVQLPVIQKISDGVVMQDTEFSSRTTMIPEIRIANEVRSDMILPALLVAQSPTKYVSFQYEHTVPTDSHSLDDKILLASQECATSAFTNVRKRSESFSVSSGHNLSYKSQTIRYAPKKRSSLRQLPQKHLLGHQMPLPGVTSAYQSKWIHRADNGNYPSLDSSRQNQMIKQGVSTTSDAYFSPWNEIIGNSKLPPSSLFPKDTVIEKVNSKPFVDMPSSPSFASFSLNPRQRHASLSFTENSRTGSEEWRETTYFPFPPPLPSVPNVIPTEPFIPKQMLRSAMIESTDLPGPSLPPSMPLSINTADIKCESLSSPERSHIASPPTSPAYMGVPYSPTQVLSPRFRNFERLSSISSESTFQIAELNNVQKSTPMDLSVREDSNSSTTKNSFNYQQNVLLSPGSDSSSYFIGLSPSSKSQSDKPFKCDTCGKCFNQKAHCAAHIRTHTGERPFQCETCQKRFVSKASLKTHERTHSGEKPYWCKQCNKGFSQLRNYRYHRSLHEGTKEFACNCPVCGKYFNDRGYLSSHLKIHRNQKEYKCQYCEKSFNQRVAYNMHVRIHTGEKPHKCPDCDKCFSRKMLLKQHLRIHTGERPYTCHVCEKTFADRSNMMLHQRLHTGVKPYSCKLCKKSFTKNHHLKTHMNYHTGVKPYECEQCGMKFSQSSNMRTHYRKCAEKPQSNSNSEGYQNVPVTVSSISMPLL